MVNNAEHSLFSEVKLLYEEPRTHVIHQIQVTHILLRLGQEVAALILAVYQEHISPDVGNLVEFVNLSILLVLWKIRTQEGSTKVSVRILENH